MCYVPFYRCYEKRSKFYDLFEESEYVIWQQAMESKFNAY